jgi:RHS repeat-associated protein
VDGLGNVIALTDSATKTVQRSYEFDDWGGLINGADAKPFTNADRARFKGALWLGPQVELYYMRARWYEPNSGRFLSEDPIGLAGGINSYAYAGDDPVNGRDPSGTCKWEEVYLGQVSYYNSEGALQVDAVYAYECVGAGPPETPYPGPGGRGEAGGPGGEDADEKDPLERLICSLLGSVPVTYSFGWALDMVPVYGPVLGSGVFIGGSGIGGYKKTGTAWGYDISFGYEHSTTFGSYGGTVTDVAIGTTTRAGGVSWNETSGTISTQTGPTMWPGSARAGTTTTTPTFYLADCRQ